MKKYLIILGLFSVLIGLSSCEKDKEPVLGSIYGVVSDLASGAPVLGANVLLQPTGVSKTTGSDGLYEFLDVEDGNYSIIVSKKGYSDLIAGNITVKDGRHVKRDVQIEKLVPKLTVVDEDGNDVSVLDFGDNPADVIRSFLIINKGEDKLTWSMEYECTWISFNKTSGDLMPGDDPQPLKITIDRSKLNVGKNTTTIHILSNGGTKQITVSATRANVIETLPASGEQARSAVLNGRIIQDLSPSITEYGFVYNKNGAPSIENGATIVKMPGLPSIGATYNALVSDLEIQTWYYVRAYATNGTITVYGDDKGFVTEDGKPYVETLGYTNLTSSSVKIQCNVKSDGGSELEGRGVCYGLSPEPKIDGPTVEDGSKGVGPYECSLTELLPNKRYYVRAYARNKDRTGYGEELTLDTKDGLAVVSIGQVSSVTSYCAVCSAKVESDGGREVTERGICWSTKKNPTVNDYKKADGLAGTGSFSCTMDNLQPGTTYYVKAYAINSADIAYSNQQKEFTTETMAPTVSTQAPSDITSSSAKISGTISSTGGATISDAGFFYQAEGATSVQKVQTQASTGAFYCQLTNLEPGTKYYVKAYATNKAGKTGEGAIVSFTTKSGLPQVSTVSSSKVGSTSATVTGKVISNGGFTITQCAICYSKTNSKPSLSDNVVYATTPTQSGQFSCELTDLEPSTKYYARAYAINENGPAYDYTSINFKTASGTPAVTIAQQPTYNGNTATVYGRITSDGGANIEYYGVVYSTVNSNPSIDDYQAVQMEEGAPITNDFTFTVTGVPSGTMIYYRFFVVNSLDKIAYSSSGYLLNY